VAKDTAAAVITVPNTLMLCLSVGLRDISLLQWIFETLHMRQFVLVYNFWMVKNTKGLLLYADNCLDSSQAHGSAADRAPIVRGNFLKGERRFPKECERALWEWCAGP
jgi:hypothetical protein